jgi:hypothetical protein
MENRVKVTPRPQGIDVSKMYEDGKFKSIHMDWPTANRVQAELRQACIDAGITVRM